MHPVLVNHLTTYLAIIAMLLAGIAAERLVLGNFSDGGGLVTDSDLDKATPLAAQLEAQTALGSRFRYSVANGDKELHQLLLLDHELARNVEKILAAQFARATEILEQDRDFLNLVAEELVSFGQLDASKFAELERSVGAHSATSDVLQ
jgi:ATP-dependent Zn protease